VLASGSYDHTIKLWDVASGREVRTLVAEMSVMRGIADPKCRQ
jgi:WD40 repeat protein